MTTNPNQSLMQFPCDFPLKIIGNNSASFVQEIAAIIQKHYPTVLESSLHCKPSQNSNYLAISVTLHVQNQPSLDALYLELTQHPGIKMVL
ncbi:DUF493 domain-containing protein [bacterium]|nr:DUF493 domain-containing protein [bacterium]